jgi:uncharacterized protein
MSFTVRATADPAEVLADAGTYLSSRPTEHNLVLTLLTARVAAPEPGRYWIVGTGLETVGVALQSPLDFPAVITPMPAAAAETLVDAIATTDVELPGVNGPAATAATFAGQWTERRGTAAHPDEGMRLYELGELVAPGGVSGAARTPVAGERELVVAWAKEMLAEVGGPAGDPEAAIDRRLAIGSVWVWDDGGPRAIASWTDPIERVARIGLVYTPPEHRRRGYAGAVVAAASAELIGRGLRCILYTQLANPTSNAIYRRLGYRAIQEALRYRFE